MAHELQESYSKLVLAKLRKTSIFASLFHTRYEVTPITKKKQLFMNQLLMKYKN